MSLIITLDRSIRRVRLAHYVVYTLGIPVPRTLAFVGGFVAQVILVLAFFKLI